jgi:hypothetical protein
MRNNLHSFSSFNESMEDKHKQLSKELKDLQREKEKMLVVRPKKERDADIIKISKDIDLKNNEYKSALKEYLKNKKEDK